MLVGISKMSNGERAKRNILFALRSFNFRIMKVSLTYTKKTEHYTHLIW